MMIRNNSISLLINHLLPLPCIWARLVGEIHKMRREGGDGGCCGNTNDTHPLCLCVLALSSRYYVIAAAAEVGSANPHGNIFDLTWCVCALDVSRRRIHIKTLFFFYS